MYLSLKTQLNRGSINPFIILMLSSVLGSCGHFPSVFENTNNAIPFEDIATHEFLLNEDQDIVGLVASIQTEENDTLPDIARHFGLGFNEITIANPQIDPWLQERDSKVILPLRFIFPDTKRQDIVINLANMRLFYFPKYKPGVVFTYPIGIGREGWNTPTGLTRIIAKIKNPNWHVPASIRKEHAEKGDPLPRVVAAGPENPLGNYALRLGIPSYLIHGTNKPYGVGMQISHGCVRLYPEDIESLFKQTKRGTAVRIVDQPYLLGWENDLLFLEVHKPLQQNNVFKKKLLKRLQRISKQRGISIDPVKVEKILKQASGIPVLLINKHAEVRASPLQILPITHPIHFYKQPVVKALTPQDWSITVGTYKNDNEAKKLVAILNHQGPPIPARLIQEAGLSHVVAGPYTSREKVISVMTRIKQEFNISGKIRPPQPQELLENTTQTLWPVGLFKGDK